VLCESGSTLALGSLCRDDRAKVIQVKVQKVHVLGCWSECDLHISYTSQTAYQAEKKKKGLVVNLNAIGNIAIW